MDTLPANISIANAPLPETYEAAKSALATCERIDECQDWANKAEALAAYARMSDDDTLRKLADRIQARAVRRAGQLLRQIDGRGRPKNNGGAPVISQRQAASDARLSPDQQLQAVRVSKVDESTFNAAVESDDPPTVTALAEQGKKSRITIDRPENFEAATKVIGAIRRCVAAFKEHEPEFVIDGIGKTEVAEMREAVTVMDTWLDRFIVQLSE